MIERAKQAGCEDPEEAFKAFKEVVAAAARGTQRLGLSGVAAFRSLMRKYVYFTVTQLPGVGVPLSALTAVHI